MSDTVVKVQPQQWLEVKYNGHIYLVGVARLLDLFNKEMDNEQEIHTTNT